MDVLEKVRSTLGAYNATDVRALLQADHQEIRRLAKDLADATTSPRRRSLLKQLKPLLVAHSRAEESAVYVPLTELRSSPDSRLAASEGAVSPPTVSRALPPVGQMDTFLRALFGALGVPVTRGGNPVCCVSIRPLAGAAALPTTGVEFLRRALW